MKDVENGDVERVSVSERDASGDRSRWASVGTHPDSGVVHVEGCLVVDGRIRLLIE